MIAIGGPDYGATFFTEAQMAKTFYSPGPIRPEDQYVVLGPPMLLGGRTYAPGHPIDVSKLSRMRIRQLLEYKRIIPRRLYLKVTGRDVLSEDAFTPIGARGAALDIEAAPQPKPKPEPEPESSFGTTPKSSKKKTKATKAKSGRMTGGVDGVSR